jgi:hypothetical protein
MTKAKTILSLIIFISIIAAMFYSKALFITGGAFVVTAILNFFDKPAVKPQQTENEQRNNQPNH